MFDTQVGFWKKPLYNDLQELFRNISSEILNYFLVINTSLLRDRIKFTLCQYCIGDT